MSERTAPLAGGVQGVPHGIRNTHAGGAECILIFRHKPLALQVRG
jgi:hypothetical protein